MGNVRLDVWMMRALLLGAGAIVAVQAAAEEPGKITCRGKAVDSAGGPVAGAEVVALRQSYDLSTETLKLTPLGQATSDARGAFSFTASRTPAPSKCLIAARKAGLALGWDEWPLQLDYDVKIVLGKPEVLAGHVDGERFKPIAGAQVRAILSRLTDKGTAKLPGVAPLGWLVARTDEQGRFRLAGIPGDATAVFLIAAPGRARVWADRGIVAAGLEYRPGRRICIRRAAEATVRGVVVAEGTGKPVVGLRLMLHRPGRPLVMPPVVAVTAADGTFTVKGLEKDRYYVKAARANDKAFYWATRPLSVQPQDGATAKPVKLELIEGASVEVTIVNQATGEPIGGAWVFLGRLGATPYRPYAYTAGDGVARMRVSPDQYYVAPVPILNRFYRNDAERRPDILEGAVARYEFKFRPLPTLRGVVRDAQGNAVPRADVRVLPGGWRHVSTDRAGRFEIRWDPEVRWGDDPRVLVARHARRRLVAAVDVGGNVAMDVRLDPGVLVTGRVVNDSGKPLADARVNAYLRMGSGASRMFFGPETSVSGQYQIRAVPAGRKHRLVARADGHAGGWVDIDLSKITGERARALDIVLEPAEEAISGIVTDEAGNRLQGAQVRSRYSTVPGHDAEQTVRTDAAGKFTIKRLPKRRIRLFASVRQRLLYGYTEAQAGSSDVRIAVRKGRFEHDRAVLREH